MAIYFSWDLLSRRFQRACSEAETNRRIMEKMGINFWVKKEWNTFYTLAQKTCYTRENIKLR
jgi:hypothetical protein